LISKSLSPKTGGHHGNGSQAIGRIEGKCGASFSADCGATRGAFDNYFNFIQRAVSSYPSGGTELAQKLKSYTEKNIASAHEFVHRLSQAKDLQDVIQIQAEFMQGQFNAFGEQAKSLGETLTKVTTGAMQTPFKKS
jgi:hypothetical protein